MEIQRTISQVVSSYRDQLTNFVHETLNGSMDGIDLRRAHREMIRRLGPSAYIEGLREGGIPQEEMDAEDRKAIQVWMTEQLQHVNQFAADAVAARGDDGKRSAILARVDLWVNAMQTIGGMGLMSAKKNQAGTWRLGATEKHCKTCNALHGKRHRLSWYSSRGLVPREPGSKTLACKGYGCKCYITDDEGNVLIPTIGRAERFDPNQPRDPEGKWTDTSASVDDRRISEIVKQLGIDAKIKIAESSGDSFQEASTDSDGNITIYPEGLRLSDDKLKGVIAHEYTHSKLKKMGNSYIAPMRQAASEIGEDDWQQLFIDMGGVSPYSDEFWHSPNMKDGDIIRPGYFKLAVHETLAETARLKAEGLPVTPIWDDLYYKIMGKYHI